MRVPLHEEDLISHAPQSETEPPPPFADMAAGPVNHCGEIQMPAVTTMNPVIAGEGDASGGISAHAQGSGRAALGNW